MGEEKRAGRKRELMSVKRVIHPALAELEKCPVRPQPLLLPMAMEPSLELTGRICVYIQIGGHPEIAAQAHGLSPQTWESWLARGSRALNRPPIEESELLYADLVLKVRQAVARSELRDVARIDAAGSYDWKASLQKLKARHGERWNPEQRSRVTVAGDPEAPLELLQHQGYQPIKVEELDLAACEAILAQLEQSRARARQNPPLLIESSPEPARALPGPTGGNPPPAAPPEDTTGGAPEMPEL
jgi:hypothetical protein